MVRVSERTFGYVNLGGIAEAEAFVPCVGQGLFFFYAESPVDLPVWQKTSGGAHFCMQECICIKIQLSCCILSVLARREGHLPPESNYIVVCYSGSVK